MIIKKRPIITWLLNPDTPGFQNGITIAKPQRHINLEILNNELDFLKDIRGLKPIWGLPELVMPSFKKAMEKNAPTFENDMPDLFQKFSNTNECGILIIRENETFVYIFDDNELNIWHFIEQDGHSRFHFAAGLKYENGQPKLLITDSILYDNNLFVGTIQSRIDEIGLYPRFIAIYLAVKKYGPCETTIIPTGTFTAIDGTPLEHVDKKKILNQTGQEVIVMDSKWFKKIVNDNDIYVRDFLRMQNKKNADGEWYKELTHVKAHIRHGYHRNAKIEESKSEEPKCS